MRRGVVMMATAALSFGALVAPPSAPTVDAAPAGDDAVVGFLVRGVGNGHGRGMSQWGSYGRAIAGQTWQEILAAYYGGTLPGTASKPDLRVRLTPWDGVASVAVISRPGTASWNGSPGTFTSMYAVETSNNRFDVYGATSGFGCYGSSSFVVPKVPLAQPATGQDVTRMQQLLAHFGFSPGPIDGKFGQQTENALRAFEAAEGLVVNGTWDAADWTRAEQRLQGQDAPPWQLLGSGVAGPIRFTTSTNQSTAASADVLGVCRRDGAVTHYRGMIEFLNGSDGTNRVVNQLDVENYLRGVVPKESPASWGNAANGAGMHALRAQAVGARSYALTQARYSYASTCDTSSCQVYGGAALRVNASTANSVRVEHANTDTAIKDTAGAVRRWPDGRLVSTEYSASNGPRTAGGSFPAVDDPFDDQPGNPLHRWTRIVSAGALMSRYGLSTADAVRTERAPASSDPRLNYDGIWGNRVNLGNGSTVSAWEFRNAFGLPAPGFELVPIRRDLTGAGSFAFIGDSVGVSVTESAASPFRVLTDGVFTAARFDSLVNRRTQGGTVADGVGAARQVPIGTDVVVVALGYNDDPAQMSGRIDAVMTELRAREVGQVAWVTMSERRATYVAANQALRAAMSRWSELIVLDWHAASSHRVADRWFTDGVHLSATGRAEYSLFLRDSVVAILSDGYVPPRPMVPGVPLRVKVAGVAGVPAAGGGDGGGGAAGVALNVTAVRTSGWGFVQVWPCGSAKPSTSSVNFTSAGAVEPNAVLVPVDETGEVCVSSSVATDLLVDVAGWFESGLRSASGELRLVDTREGRGGARLTAGVPLRVKVAGVAGVPAAGGGDGGGDAAGVAGVALNVTAVRTSGWGFVQVWPCGSAKPSTSSVNFTSAGAVEPNAVLVPVDETGEVCVSSSVATDLLVDVTAWFDAGLRAGSGELRLVDTRVGSRVTR